MKSAGRPIARLVLLAGLCLGAAPLCPSPSPTKTGSRPLPGALARYDALRPPEVRLRKVHLVRPDLIPYPIEYEVVC